MTDIPLFTEVKLTTANRKMNEMKIPGLDGISSEILKLVSPQTLLAMYNTCLRYFLKEIEESETIPY